MSWTPPPWPEEEYYREDKELRFDPLTWRVRERLGVEGFDNRLLWILRRAVVNFIVSYCNIQEWTDEIEEAMECPIEEMIVWKYNRIGTEGLTNESYSGVSYAYENDYPEWIMKMLRPYRRIRTIRSKGV